MKTKDIIVIGASAGGISALKNLVKSLPPDFTGYIFIVLHIPAYSQTALPQILSAAGPLKAVLATDNQRIERGKIYIAPNNYHMLLEDGRVIVRNGPKENRFRPSIDALFRSAAYVYGSRVVGIVLSGVLNDGTSGLWTIKRLGGTAIIQDPRDAEQPQMPENAREYIEVDHILPASEMGSLLSDIIKQPATKKVKVPKKELEQLKTEIKIATKDGAFEMGIIHMGELTSFTCPECHGALVRLKEGKIIRFRCHTGHAYTASALLAEVTESVEDMLWQSMRGMEEMNMLLRNIADHFKSLNNTAAAETFLRKSKLAASQAQIIHDSIFRMEQYSEDLRFKAETKSVSSKKLK